MNSAATPTPNSESNGMRGPGPGRGQPKFMGKGSLITNRNSATPFLSHASGVLVVFFLASWLRSVRLKSDPTLQVYMQVTTGLLAFVFAAVALVRFQGTQDRISLILGS